MTLMVHWNHIDENCQVVKVEGGSYDCIIVRKSKSYGLSQTYEFDVTHLG